MRFRLHFWAVTALSPLAFGSAAGQSGAAGEADKPVVMISYPAGITPAALQQFEGQYLKVRWPDKCSQTIFGMDDCGMKESALREAIVKTQYYVPDVRRAAEAAFPNALVIAQPGFLDVLPNGTFTYKVADAELPANVRIDFLARVSTRQIMASNWTHPSTDGLYVVPAFVVTSCSQPMKCSLVAASKGLARPLPTDAEQPSALLHLLPSASPGSSPVPGVQVIPASTSKLTDEQWAHVTSDGTTPFAEKLFLPYLTQLRPLLNLKERLRPSLNGAFGLIYRPYLGGRSDSEQILDEFAVAETDFLYNVSEQQISTIRRTDFGISMRKTILAEREHKKKAARSEWLGALLMIGAGAADSAAGGFYGTGQLAQLAKFEEQARSMHSAFSSSFAPLTERQYEVSVRTADKLSKIQARNVHELRNELKLILSPDVPN